MRLLLKVAGLAVACVAAYAAVFLFAFAYESAPAALAWQPSLAAAALAGVLAWRGADTRTALRIAAVVTACAAVGAGAWLSGWISPAPQPTRQPASSADGVVAVRGGTMFFHQSATSESGRPVVLVLHGGPGSGSISLRAALEPLIGPTVRAIFYDQRGVGRSSSASSFGLDDYLDDVERLRTALGVERWHLVGVSWGAAIAVEYGLRHPDRVQDIVTWGGLVASQSSTHAQLGALAAYYAAAGDRDSEAWARTLAAQPAPYSRIQTLRVMNAVNRSRLKTVLTPAQENERVRAARRRAVDDWGYTAGETTSGMWATLATFMQTGLETYDARPRLKELRVPLLVLAGERDPLLAGSGIDRDAATAPQGTFRRVPGLGHTIDDPSALAREILDFVSRHEGP